MKSIILFRHGQAQNGWLYEDYDRPLTHSGVLEADKMGHHLSGKNESPDLVITSSAIRAMTTAEIAIVSGNWDCPLHTKSEIYGGPPLFLLSLIKKQNNKYSTICLVGHEPNFSSFITLLTDIPKVIFPTASMVRIDFNVVRWNDVIVGFGNLAWILSPGELSSM